jgi:hypothetical protein
MSHFQFPNACPRCLAKEPTQCWPLAYSEYESRGRATIITTYYANVPVCRPCYREMNGFKWASYVVGAMIGIATGWLIYQALDGATDESLGYPRALFAMVGVTFGGVAGFFAALILQVLLLDIGRFGHYRADENRLVFRDKSYQAMFDELNPRVEERVWMAR